MIVLNVIESALGTIEVVQRRPPGSLLYKQAAKAGQSAMARVWRHMSMRYTGLFFRTIFAMCLCRNQSGAGR
jgi:hypothetical protein